MQRMLTSDKQQQICSVISFGGTRVMAARVVGCCPRTIWNTVKVDKKFAIDLRKAEESPELAYLMAVANASNSGKQWRAAIWALERMFPDRFAKRSPTAFTLEQMREVMDAIVATISRSVPGKVNREMIRRKIDQYADSLARGPRNKTRRKRHAKRRPSAR